MKKVKHLRRRKVRTPAEEAKRKAKLLRWRNVQKKRLLARGILWTHIGGGCVLVGKLEYPCDDTFENLKTGRLAEFSTTLEAHQSIPHELRSGA